MGTRKFSPVTPSRRYITVSDFAEVTKDRPERALVESLGKSGGRNNLGRVTAWQRGGGHKRRYRLIDFSREKEGVPGRVAAVEYDPNRTARIALVNYADGEKRYILAANGMKVGDAVVTSNGADILPGNCMQLGSVPLGTFVHNVDSRSGGADSSAVPLGRSRRSWRRKATSSCFVCQAASFGRFTSAAGRPSVRSATSTTRTSSWARLAGPGGSVVGPSSAAQP